LVVEWTFYCPTFYPAFLPPLFQVFPEAGSILVVGLGVVFAAAALFPWVAVSVAEPEAVFAAALEAAEPGLVFVSETQASVDIVSASPVLVAASVFLIGVYSSGRPRFLFFPNIGHYSSSSSSVEVVCEESVHSSIGARTNCGFCNVFSSPDLHQNKNLGHSYNNSSPGHNNVTNTSDLPIDATTSHSRNKGLH